MKRYYFDPCGCRHTEPEVKEKAPYQPEENWLPFSIAMILVGFCLIHVV